MAATAPSESRSALPIVLATGNQSKAERLTRALEHSPLVSVAMLGLADIASFKPSEAGLPYESDRALAKASLAHELTGKASLGWDDGMYVGTRQIPGPDIKATVGENPTRQQIFDYYQAMFEELPAEQRKGVIKRSFCLVGEDGKPYLTARMIPVQFDTSHAMKETGNPLDAMIVPSGFDKPFADFTPEDRQRYDEHLTQAVEDLAEEKNKRDNGETTRRSMELNGRVWVFSRRDMHLFNPEDEEGVARLAGVLNDSYAGLQHGWVAKKYGTASENDELDPNGFFSKRRGLLLIGEAGDPNAMLSWVLKRGGSMKTNTLRVADTHQREGLGKAIKQEMILMAEATNVRKLYCTTSRQNTPALGLNLGLGYKVEAEFPSHYRLDKDEVILGKILRPVESVADTSKTMLQQTENGSPGVVDVFDPARDTEGFRSLVQNALTGWHDDVGNDFIDNTLQGALRGVEDVNGKGKFILVSRTQTGEVIGTAVLTLKMGGPAKIYPLIGTKEAQADLLAQIIERAKALKSHVVYTFSPEWDLAEHASLEELGFAPRGVIESPYKPGANLVPWSKHI